MMRRVLVAWVSAVCLFAEGTTIRGDELYSAGTAALLKGNWAEAEKSFRQLRTEFPEDVRWGPGLSAAIYQDARRQDTLETLMDAGAANREPSTQYLSVGQALRNRGRDREAIQELETALQLTESPAARSADYSLIGLVHMRLEEKDEAITAYRSALKEDSSNVNAMNNLAYEWAERGENLDEALAHAKRAAQLQQGNANILDTLGWVYFKKGMLADAESTLVRGMLLDRSSDGSRGHLAAVMDASTSAEATADRRELRRLLEGELSGDQKARLKDLLQQIQGR